MATRSTTRGLAQAKEAAGEQQLTGLKLPSTCRGKAREGDEQSVADPAAAAHATRAKGGRTSRCAAAKPEQLQQASPDRATKRRRARATQELPPEPPPPASPEEEDSATLDLALLPGDVLDHVLSLLAAGERGSCIRATCSWLRGAFDCCNTRLVLRGTEQQLPVSFPARLLDLVRHSPRVSSLTLAGDEKGVTWPQVLEAGGPALLQRLEALTLARARPYALDLAALGACTRLQRLRVLGRQQPQQPALTLQPLAAAAGGTLRHLEIQDCGSVRDFSPLAACTALQHLTLGSLGHCRHLLDLAPLAACRQLQHLTLGHVAALTHLAACGGGLRHLELHDCSSVRDFAPLAACPALQHLELGGCHHLASAHLTTLAACTELRHLRIANCGLLTDLSPLAACCAQLQVLHLHFCPDTKDLAPLAACTALRELDLDICHKLSSLTPLAACAALQRLGLGRCRMVEDLAPLAACAVPGWRQPPRPVPAGRMRPAAGAAGPREPAAGGPGPPGGLH